MRLLYTPTSPYARKVRIALREKGIACEEVFVPPSDSAVADQNPLGKVPALARDDGRALYDSPVILQYLELVAPTPALYPADAPARVEALRWEALCDGICDATVTRMLEGRRASPEAGALAHQEAKIARGLAAVERDLAGRAFAVGDTYSVADVAAAATVGYVDLRAGALLDAYPKLRVWYKAQLARPSVAATVPPR
ncbi:MAG: glutathione S-transferase family protein [Myxococcota bacterium]